jgi:alpha-methylacyl-CoA racemase
MTAGMLDGITVLDVSTVGPAARATRWLGDWGATVVKVGPVPSDSAVQITPPHYAYSGGRDQRRVALDVRDERGRAAFLALVRNADVVVESFRPGVVARLGIGWEAASAVNPRIVYCSTSGYGQDGPRAQWAGHDLNYLATGGYLHCTQHRADGGPPIPGATIADAAAGGMQAVMAILAALVARERTGTGTYLDVSIADGVVALMSLYVDEYLAVGTEPEPGHYVLTGRYACYDVYRCADDRWLSVAAIEHRFWANLCQALGLEQWIDHQMDDEVAEEVRADVAAAIATRTRDDWVAELAPGDCCVAPVLSVPEVVADESAAERHLITEATSAQHGTFGQVARILAGQDRAAPGGNLPDSGSTDTDALLSAAGLAADELAALHAEGVIA